MDLGLKDRVAIVGGSSRGMGRAIALAFAQEGANVTVCARGETDLRRTEMELSRISSQAHVLAVPADLSQLRDIRRVVRDTLNRFGRISVLVTHVGYGPASGRPSEFEDATIMQTMEGNFLSAVRLAKEVVPFMKQQHWGRIVNLLPELSLRLPDGTALANSSQMALVGYSKMLANELAPFNITVNNLVSGPVETEFLKGEFHSRAQARGATADELREELVATIPMRRMGTAEEVGDLAAFLASERAAFLTGASVVLDGGMLQAVR